MSKSALSSSYPVEISQEIEQSLLSFSTITGLPVTYYDLKCQVRLEYGSSQKICKFLPVYNKESSVCRHHLLSAIRTAATLGEPYFFVCGAGFVNIAIPLMQQGTQFGCFVAGPIMMEKFSQRTVSRLLALNLTQEALASSKDLDSHSDILAGVVSILREMTIYSSRQVAHLATLLNNSVIANLKDKTDYVKVNARYREQVQIGDDLRGLKRSGKETGYPLAAEERLLSGIRAGKETEAIEAMAAYLNGVLLYEAGNLDLVKVHLIELCALISRGAPEPLSGTGNPIQDSFAFIDALNRAESIREVKEWSESLVKHYLVRSGHPAYSGNAPLILQTLRLLSTEGNDSWALTQVAAQLHVNSSYLSGLFKKETGMGFAAFVANQKIERSVELLEKTNLRLLEIADLCGFEDQSYFTKVFTKVKGISPSQYRKDLNSSLPNSDR